eukprot:3940562-Rhodomonas_salina.2
MSGTELAYGATRSTFWTRTKTGALSLCECAPRCSVLTCRISLCACYAKSGTDVAYLLMRLLREVRY